MRIIIGLLCAFLAATASAKGRSARRSEVLSAQLLVAGVSLPARTAVVLRTTDVDLDTGEYEPGARWVVVEATLPEAASLCGVPFPRGARLAFEDQKGERWIEGRPVGAVDFGGGVVLEAQPEATGSALSFACHDRRARPRAGRLAADWRDGARLFRRGAIIVWGPDGSLGYVYGAVDGPLVGGQAFAGVLGIWFGVHNDVAELNPSGGTEVVVDGYACAIAPDHSRSLSFHPNGRLRSCCLARDQPVPGLRAPIGDLVAHFYVELAPDGRVLHTELGKSIELPGGAVVPAGCDVAFDPAARSLRIALACGPLTVIGKCRSWVQFSEDGRFAACD